DRGIQSDRQSSRRGCANQGHFLLARGESLRCDFQYVFAGRQPIETESSARIALRVPRRVCAACQADFGADDEIAALISYLAGKLGGLWAPLDRCRQGQGSEQHRDFEESCHCLTTFALVSARLVSRVRGVTDTIWPAAGAICFW